MTFGIVACGALAGDVRDIAARRGWDVEVAAVSALDHLRPERIAGDVVRVLDRRADDWDRAAVAFADCGTAGALDATLAGRGVPRLAGVDCYHIYGGGLVTDLLAEEPGTYLLTDFLVRAWEAAVVVPLGLDRFPDLVDDYFRHYRRVVWLTQGDEAALAADAARIAASLSLPLELRRTGTRGLEHHLGVLVGGT